MCSFVLQESIDKVTMTVETGSSAIVPLSSSSFCAMRISVSGHVSPTHTISRVVVRKRALPLTMSGFLFSCLYIYGQLPEYETWRIGYSRSHEAHLIYFSDGDGEWAADIAHSPKRSPEMKVGNWSLPMPEKIDWGVKSQNVSAFLQRGYKKTYMFRSFKKRNRNVRNNTSSNGVGNRKTGREFVHVTRKKPGKRMRGYDSSSYIKAEVKKSVQRDAGNNIVRVIVTNKGRTAETNTKQVGPSVDINSPQNVSIQQQSIFFLKVHKAASTTVHNIFMRFSLTKNLDVMLPKTSNILSETGYKIKPDILHPYPPDLQFNIICNHVIFNKEYLSQFLKYPKSTIYVGIVREPFSQFRSAFYYYLNTFKRRKLVDIAMDNPEHPIRGFLQNPLKHVDSQNYASGLSFINNRMSADFGFPMWFMEEDKHNDELIKRFLRKTEKIFHLVMVVDMFEESVVLLRRLLNWTVKDVLYINSNTFEHSKQEQTLHFPWQVNTNFTDEDRRLHQEYARVDYALYNHFREVLLQKLQNQPPVFKEEVFMFKNVLREVTDFCTNGEHGSNDASKLIISANSWTEEFTINEGDCKFLQMSELQLVNTARDVQKARYHG